MRFLSILILMLTLGSNSSSAQSKSDFSSRVENCFLKLQENPDTAIRAAKELRQDDDDLVVKDILAQAYLLKGNYLESVRIAFETSSLKNPEQEMLIRLMIAREFYQLNLYEQASKVIEPIAVPPKASRSDQEVLAQILQLKAKIYLALKQYDKAEKSLIRSSDFSNRKERILLIKTNELLRATIEFEKGNLKEAITITDQLLQNLSSTSRALYLEARANQFRGLLYFQENRYREAISSLEKARSLVEKSTYEPLKTSIYEDLARNYLVINENEKYEEYRTNFMDSSRLLEENKQEARREMIQLSTDLTAENNKMILEKKRNNLMLIVGISVLLLVLLGYRFIREVQSSLILRKQISFFRSINFKQNNSVKVADPKEPLLTSEVQKKQLIIPKEKEAEILKGLEQFESAKKYLDNNMSLPTLAGELNTNTKYLSEIINKYKNKNFSTYINELRIKHIIQLLASDRSYLQYKISYIAEIGGFTSHSAFTNIFKSVTGMSPNEYMQTLRQQS